MAAVAERSCGGDVQRSRVTIFFSGSTQLAFPPCIPPIQTFRRVVPFHPSHLTAGSEALSYGHPWFTSSPTRKAHEAARHQCGKGGITTGLAGILSRAYLSPTSCNKLRLEKRKAMTRMSRSFDTSLLFVNATVLLMERPC